jgi:hypothetical protein
MGWFVGFMTAKGVPGRGAVAGGLVGIAAAIIFGLAG